MSYKLLIWTWFVLPIALWIHKTFENIWNIFVYIFQIITSSHYVCLKMQPHHVVACIEIFSTSQKLVDNLIMSKSNLQITLWTLGIPHKFEFLKSKFNLGVLIHAFFWFSHTFISCRRVFAFYCIHLKFDTLLKLMLELELESFQLFRKDKHQMNKSFQKLVPKVFKKWEWVYTFLQTYCC
jgi:hypothetical protein